MTPHAVIVRAIAIVLLLGACGEISVAETAATSTAPSTTVRSEVVVAEDLSYRSGDLRPNRVDIYYSPGRAGGPVVVLFHGGDASKSHSLYRQLAPALAEQGAVVFVPNWGGPRTGDPAEFLTLYDLAACAVSHALALAGDYGADTETLVLFGHSAGASAAAIGGLREPTPVTDCSVEMTPFEADGLVLWDGDWMLADPSWDQSFSETLPQLVEVNPWAWLADGPREGPRARRVGQATGERHLAKGARADDQVGTAFTVRAQERGDLGGIVLAIGIEGEHCVIPAI